MKPESQNDTVFNTLNESIKDTIYRDLKGIWNNLKYVLLPKAYLENCAQLRDWDLWGPLFLCLVLNIILWIKSEAEDKRVLFSLLFVLIWAGAVIITLNALLLEATLSIFQGLCVLGYCLFPIDLATLVTAFLPSSLLILKIILFAIAIIWSIRVNEKKGLILYPVYLFYVTISWIALSP